MKLIFTFLILSSSFLIILHGGHEAFFTIESSSEGWILSTKMEQGDLEEELKKNGYSTGNLAAGLNAYLKDKLSIKVDGTELQLTFESSFTEKGYLHSKYSLTPVVEDISEMEIENHCFEGFDHNYFNLVTVRVSGVEVSYKMTDERPLIVHKFE